MATHDRGPSRRAVLAGGTGVLAALAGCATGSGPAGPGGETAAPGGGDGWRAAELTDVLTDETFTLGQFGSRTVLVEFFAVWCLACTEQQREMASLLAGADDVVAVSLNVDPNEDAAAIRSHATEHGFDWRYAVTPPAMTRALLEEFGPVVTNPPSIPIVRLCPGGGASLLDGRNVKSADSLADATEQC